MFHTGDWSETSLGESPRLLWQILTHSAGLGAAPILTIYIGVGAVVGLVGIAAGVGWRHWTKHRDEGAKGARWAKPRDLKPLLVRRPQPGRLTLGTVDKRLVATEQRHSVAVIGPAGTGKTTGFAIPALLEWDGPVLATSIKGDLVEHTIDQRQRVGEVWVYDPTGSTGHPPAGWNPLSGSLEWQGALRMAAWLVSTARAGERGGLQDSDFWYAVAQKLLAPLLYAAAISGRTMRDVVRWVDLQDVEEPAAALYASGQLDAIQAFEATTNREEKALSSAYTTTETVIAAFSDPSVLATTMATPSIAPTRLLDGGNHTLYICGPLHEQARLRPLFTAVIEETVHAVYSRANRPETRLTKPLLLVIDEAANIAPLPDLAQIASTARGVGIQLVTVWQDFAQLQARYGTFAQTVINNHRAKVVLSGVSDAPTLEYISRLIGDEARTETSQVRDQTGNVRSTSEVVRHQPLAPPAQLRQADFLYGVLVYGSLAPARLRLRSVT
jgi:type IV secretion system protein VirD4